MFSSRIAVGVLVFVALVTPAWGGHTLTSQEQKVLGVWLARHPDFSIATDTDCDCAEDIQQMRTGYGGNWPPVPDYHPYVATGDFNSDGVRDFAVVVIDRSKSAQNFVLLVFNGPFGSKSATPAFVGSGLDLRHEGLSLTAATETIPACDGPFRERQHRDFGSAGPHLQVTGKRRGLRILGTLNRRFEREFFHSLVVLNLSGLRVNQELSSVAGVLLRDAVIIFV